MAIDDNTSYELTGYQVKDLATKVKGKADSSSLASVATSGLYSDLTGKPTIPTVNNGTLTIQHNGTSAGTFTANQSTNSTVNIETIYADDYIDTTALTPIVSTSMIDDEAVTTAKIDDGAVTAAKTAFGGNYSTTEVDTGFTWVDGKHIYKKTINFGALPNNTTKTVDHNISNLDRIIKIEQSITNGSSNSHGFLHICSGSVNNIGFNLYGTNTAIAVNTAHDRSDCSAFFTLFYTKSS